LRINPLFTIAQESSVEGTSANPLSPMRIGAGARTAVTDR
jgi:hypothetical protein